MNIVSLFFTCIILFAYSLHSLEITSPPEYVGESIDWVNAIFSGPITATGVESLLVVPRNNSAACYPFSDSLYDSYSGKIIMVVRGTCSLADKAINVAKIGGVATIIANDVSGELIPGGRVIAPHPVVGISKETADRLRSLNRTTDGAIRMKINQNPIVQTHLKAMIELYTNTNGLQWRYNGVSTPIGWPQLFTDPCQTPWEGITCNPDGTIRSIVLDRLNLQGAIPDSFSELTSIQRIIITNNYLTGPIPAFFSTYTKLMKLQLSQNEMNGELFPNWENLPLESLQLDRNMFSGNIPSSIFANPRLKTLSLASNRFEGTIDSSISLLKNLTILDLRSNSLSGPYPRIFNPLFYVFNIANNRFSGPVPTNVSSMRLESFDISYNEFDYFPPYAVASMDAMRFLDISHNKFTGAVPVPGPKTRFFIANNNRFTSVTVELQYCYFLALVDLSSNELTGTYTNHLARLPVPIASEVSDNQCLQYIDFSHNKITSTTGIFQLGLDKWPLLVEFSFRNNSISSELSLLAPNLIYLRSVDISQNDITGVIPEILTSLPRLTTRNFNMSFTKMRYADSYLPDNVYTDLSVSTYVQGGNMSCPKILTISGAEIIVDNKYHDFELCSCEPGYRRRINHPNPAFANVSFDCHPCPEGLECPGRLNDTKFTFVKNFYPSPTAEDPIALIPCKSCMPESGDVFQCKEHHSGRMCSSCDRGYFWSGVSCDKCIPVGSTLIVCSIIILVLIILAYGAYSLFLRGLLCVPLSDSPTREDLELEDVKPNKSHKIFTDRRMEAYETEKANTVDIDLRSIASISIAINYYQTVSALSQYFSLPNSIISLMATSRILSSASGAGVSLSCISYHLNDYSNLYTAVMLEPVLMIGGVAFVYLLGRIAILISHFAFKKKTPMLLRQWNITCLTMLLFGLNFLFFPVSSNAINSFRCTEDPATTIKYNSAYPNSQILALILFSGGILVIFSLLIFAYNRSKPGNKVYTIIGNSFGFIFLHYRKKYTFFAIVVLFRRFILSLLISIVRVNSVLSFGLISAILVISISLNHLVQPFRTLRDNHLETLTLVATFFAYALAFTLSINELDYGSAPVVVFYFAVNVGIIIWCAYEFIAGQLSRARAILAYLNCGNSKSRVASDSPRKSTNNFSNNTNISNNTKNNDNDNIKVNNNDIEEEDLDRKDVVTISLSNVKAESLKSSTASSNPDDDLDLSRSDVPMIGGTNDNN